VHLVRRVDIFPTKILLATDGSTEASLAEEAAVELSNGTGSELHVVHVLRTTPELPYPRSSAKERGSIRVEEAGRSQAPGRSREADRGSWGQHRGVALQGGRPGEGDHPSRRRARRWPDSDGRPETPMVQTDLRGWLLRERLPAGEASGSHSGRARVARLDHTEVTSALIRFSSSTSRGWTTTFSMPSDASIRLRAPVPSVFSLGDLHASRTNRATPA
jgi:Universal stress protein family